MKSVLSDLVLLEPGDSPLRLSVNIKVVSKLTKIFVQISDIIFYILL
jgi:hypothetical protein